MIKKLKSLVLNLLAGANAVTVLLMLATGYIDHLHPDSVPLLCCAGMIFPFFVLANLIFIPIWVVFSWKRLLIPVIGYALAYPPIRVFMPLHGHGEPPEGALRVVSYNVCTFGGNYKYEHAFDTIFTYLKAQQADIVCLQEDQHAPFSDYERYYPYNDTTLVSVARTNGYNCIGMHTRFPILKKERIDYPSKTNGSVAYFLLIDGDTVVVVNNHLESSHLNKNDRNRYEEMLKGGMERDTVTAETAVLISKLSEAMKVRAGQADSVACYVERHRQYPIILCGDFNDTPLSYTRRRIASMLSDCYVATGRGPGLSYNRRGFNFRIDHIMCSDHFTPYECEIDSKMDASDHYPLLCWLKMREKP